MQSYATLVARGSGLYSTMDLGFHGSWQNFFCIVSITLWKKITIETLQINFCQLDPLLNIIARGNMMVKER